MPSRRRSPTSTVHVRGNEIAVEGRRRRAGRPRSFEDLVVLVEQGHELDAAHRAPQRRHGARRRAPVGGPHLRGAAPGPGPAGAPEVERPEALRRRHPRQRHHLRRRPGRHRQELARRRHGGAGAAGQAGRPHHPHPARGGGRRAPRLPARRPHGQGRPVPAPALGRPPRHGRHRGARQAPRAGRGRGGAAGIHARPRAAGRSAGADAVGVAARSATSRSATSSSAPTAGRRRCSASTRRGGARSSACDPGRRRRRWRCAEHLWFVHDAGRPQARQGGARRCRPQEMVGRLRRHHQHRFELPLCRAPVEFEPAARADGPVRARAAARRRLHHDDDDPIVHHRGPGAGGRRSSARSTASSCHAKSEVDYVLRRVGAAGRATANPVTALLRELGLAGTTLGHEVRAARVPAELADVRLAVLQGLLDTDGGPVTQARPDRAASSTRRPRRSCTTTSCSSSARSAASPTAGCVRRRVGSPASPRAAGRTTGPTPTSSTSGCRPASSHSASRARRSRTDDFGGRPADALRRQHRARRRGRDVCIQVAAADSLYVTDDFLVTHNTLERQLHHPRRGAEHHARADEDVPHPHRLRLEGRRHRRHHPGRRGRRAQRARRARARSSRGIDGLELGAPHEQRRRAPPHRAGHRRRLRAGQPAEPTADARRAARRVPTGPTRPTCPRASTRRTCRRCR